MFANSGIPWSSVSIVIVIGSYLSQFCIRQRSTTGIDSELRLANQFDQSLSPQSVFKFVTIQILSNESADQAQNIIYNFWVHSEPLKIGARYTKKWNERRWRSTYITTEEMQKHIRPMAKWMNIVGQKLSRSRINLSEMSVTVPKKIRIHQPEGKQLRKANAVEFCWKAKLS